MLFATLNAGVSVSGQENVARIYSQRTVADINKYNYELYFGYNGCCFFKCFFKSGIGLNWF